MKPEGIDFPGVLRKINFIMSRIYNVFAQNTFGTVYLINKSGGETIRGELVKADTVTDEAFVLCAADDEECIGVIVEGGIQDGSRCRIAVSGVVDVMLKNTTLGVAGNWVKVSNAAGRADASNAAPVGADRDKGLGHCIQAVGAGTDVLCRIVLQLRN